MNQISPRLKYAVILLLFILFALIFSKFSKPIARASNQLLLTTQEVTVRKAVEPEEDAKKKNTKAIQVKSKGPAAQVKAKTLRVVKDWDGNTPVLKQTASTEKSKSFLRTFAVLAPIRLPFRNLNFKVFDLPKNTIFPGEANLDCSLIPEEKELVWRKAVSTQLSGKFDLVPLFSGVKDTKGYLAFCVVLLDLDADHENAKLLIGNDDVVQVFLNGTSVFTNTRGRGTVPDQDKCAVSLKKGINRVVVKAGNYGKNWDFALRFADEQGAPICFE